MGVFLSFFQSLFGQQNKEFNTAIEKSERIIEKLLKRKKVPGLAITVLKDGKTWHQKGYGFSDLENNIPVDPVKTVFRIASVSKPISATGLVKMVAEGTIDLDTYLHDYVPYYPKKKYDFTIRQLGNHTAGFRSYAGKEYMLNKPYSIKEGIQVFKDAPLLFEPGTNYQYTSYDWVLLSLAMQEASAVPFEEYIREKVFEPLKMNRSFPDRGDSIPNITKYYSKSRSRGFRKATEVNNFYKLAGGGFLSTSDDIAKLGQAYLDNKIGSPEIVSQFISPNMVRGQSTYYGIGWEVSFDTKNRPYFGHVGNGVGGYAMFYVYPAQRMVFSIMTNVTNPGVDKELHKIIDILIDGTSVKK